MVHPQLHVTCLGGTKLGSHLESHLVQYKEPIDWYDKYLHWGAFQICNKGLLSYGLDVSNLFGLDEDGRVDRTILISGGTKSGILPLEPWSKILSHLL